jgi:hypothetical protein
MKKTTILKLAMGLCSVLIWANCGGGDSPSESPTLAVAQTNLTLDENCKGTIMVTSNTQWTVVSSESWLSYYPNCGSGSAQVSVSAPINNTGEERVAILTFTATSNNVTATTFVTQKAAFLTINPTNMTFESAGGSNSFTIDSNISWTVSSSDSWCIVSPSSGSGKGNVTVKVAANPDPAVRKTTITVSGGPISRMITITQDAYIEDPSIGRDDFGDDDNLNNK